MLDMLYTTRGEEKAAFGENWCGPKQLEHCKDTLVAKYPKSPSGGDGQSTEVYCYAAPARFYVIRAKAEPSSINEPQSAFEVTTGSGCEEMAARIAKGIAEGMLGFAPIK